MQIISSEIIWKRIQEDGRYWVRERHVADTGEEFVRDYMNGADAEERLPIHAKEIEDAENTIVNEE